MDKGFWAELDEAFDYLMAALGLKEINPLGDKTTFLGSPCKFEGKIKCAGNAIINCLVYSDYISIEGDLIVGRKGKISSPNHAIVANKVSIDGSVHAPIKAKSLELKETGGLRGDVEVKSIHIEQGAYFKGWCYMAPREESKTKMAK